ncbi:hypothetical protein EV175_006219 [Coemansia sp. RSA 1933]|nr:hypothetical protein EV175_006219 [Coemansia sp. RSA 1933]
MSKAKKAVQTNAQNRIFDQIMTQVSGSTMVEDAEEEVCELYSRSRTLTLTIIQNPNINGELGQTGGVLWNSSVIMSEYFAQRSKWAGDGRLDVENASIVELGSGCGLVGLTLHQLGARRVVLTDQHRMLKVLNKNIKACHVPRAGQELYASEYLWGRPPEDLQIVSEPIDMVVVSDCVYHESIAPLLVQTLSDLCRRRTDGLATVVVIGQELRSDLVHQAFVEELLNIFVVHRMPVSAQLDEIYVLYAAWLKR